MVEANYQLHLLFEIPNVQLYLYDQEQVKKLDGGALGVYELKEHKLVVLRLNDWQYTLSKNIPVMTEPSQQGTYILPHQNGNYGLVVGKLSRDLNECWEGTLSMNSNFVVGQGIVMKEEEIMEQVKQTPEEIDLKGEQKEKSTSEKIGNFLTKGGDMLKDGMIMGAKFVKKGIISAGEYIQTKVTKQEEKKIDPSTLIKVQAANTTSKVMLTYTQTQVTALVKGASEIAKDLSKEAKNSDTGKKITSHKYYPDVKNVAVGTAHVVASVYCGMFEALKEIGSGFQEATTGVVTKKYGEDAGKVVNTGMDAVGNVDVISKEVQDDTKKKPKSDDKQ